MRYTLFRNAFDNLGEQRDLPWPELAAKLSRHEVGEKDGWAIAFATFEGTRVHDNLRSRTAIALDIETSKTTGEVPPSPEYMIEALRGFGAAAVLWTTFGHTTQDPRYRIVLPHREADLTDETAFMVDSYLVPAAALHLGLHGVADRSKFGATSLFFLPRTAPQRLAMARAASIEGHVIGIDSVYREAIALMVGEEVEQRRVMRNSMQLDPATRAIMDRYNEDNSIADLLGRYGYKRRGRRWKSPNQSRDSTAATEIRRDSHGEWWGSFSETDAQVGVGQRPKRSSQLLCFGDAFALFTFYECNGSFKAALNAIRQRRHNQPTGVGGDVH